MMLFSEEDLKWMAKQLRDPTKDMMKIERTEWSKHPKYQMNTKAPNIKLCIEKIENCTLCDPIDDCNYTDLFHPSVIFLRKISYVKMFTKMMSFFTMNTKKIKQKILIKGEPGMGKSTLANKIASDWASGKLTVFHLILFVPLKLMRQRDTIEDVIFRQHNALRNETAQQKLRSILDKFGNRCLLILDDLEQCVLGQGKYISDILEGKILPNCNFIVTADSSVAENIQETFDTISTVEGFAQPDGEKYVSKWSGIAEQKEQILNSETYLLNKPIKLSTCPMLLNLLCILAYIKALSISKGQISLGNIYYELIKWRFTLGRHRKNYDFDKDDFEKFLDKLGKVALQNLLLNKFLTNSYIITHVDVDAFDYDLLIRHEGCRPLGKEVKDAAITFSHRTIQEFFGAYYFILNLKREIENPKAKNKDDRDVFFETLMKGFSKRNDFIKQNAYFHEFCNWTSKHLEFHSWTNGSIG